MKKSIFLSCILAASMGAALTSCQNREEFFEDARKANWEKMVASIDPKQDWNLAENFTVSVNPDHQTSYSIYVKVDGKYKLAAKYDNVTSARELGFTAVKGTEQVLVSDGVNVQLVNVNGAFGTATRSASNWELGEFKCDESLRKGTDIEGLDLDYVTTMLPENGNNEGKDGLTEDFMFYNGNADGFTIYPVASYTGAKLRLGIYWYDEDGNRVEKEVWRLDDTMKEFDPSINTNIYRVQKAMPNGIHIRTPKNKAFGFYIDKVSVQYYSQSSLNNCGQVHSVSFEKDGITYIGFEDACKTPLDLNDLVFVVEPDLTPIVEDPVKWTVACEDLGSTCDYDFNDVVFEVEHVTGQDNVTVTPLAAGGLLGSTIYLGDTEVGEIHALLGGQPGQFLNTETFTASGTPVVIPGQSSFSIGTDMGGFRISVENNGNASIITAPVAGDVPQMMIVPEGWAWPLEHTNIMTAYPSFADWSKAAAVYNYWAQYCDASKVIKRK